MKTSEEKMKDNADLKEKINRDIERVKHLDVEIMDKKTFYGESFKYIRLSYLCFVASFFVLVIPSLLLHGDILRISAFIPSFIGFLLGMLLVHALGFLTVTKYVTLKHMIFPKLETGEIINQKILSLRNMIAGFMATLLIIYSIIACITGFHLNRLGFGSAIGAYVLWLFFPTFFFYHIVISAEFNRIGMSVLFSLVRSIVSPSNPNDSSNPTSFRSHRYNSNSDDPMSFTDPRHLNSSDPYNNPSSYERQHRGY